VVAIAVGSLSATEIPPPDKVWRLDWVRVSRAGGGCCCLFGGGSSEITNVGVISSTPSPCGAAFQFAWNWSLTPYSTTFRANDDDTLLFEGLSKSTFGGYRALSSLRDIVARKPTALQKLEEFNRGAAAGGTLSSIGLIADLAGLATIVTGSVLENKSNPPPYAKYVSYAGAGTFVLGLSLGSAGEFVSASASAKLLQSVNEFNGD